MIRANKKTFKLPIFAEITLEQYGAVGALLNFKVKTYSYTLLVVCSFKIHKNDITLIIPNCVSSLFSILSDTSANKIFGVALDRSL